MRPASAVLIGAGDRGTVYSSFALRHPVMIKITAVADPVRDRRDRIAAQHHIPQSCCFASWEELMQKKQESDGAIIATPDAIHVAPAVAALNEPVEKPFRALCIKLIN